MSVLSDTNPGMQRREGAHQPHGSWVKVTFAGLCPGHTMTLLPAQGSATRNENTMIKPQNSDKCHSRRSEWSSDQVVSAFLASHPTP